VRSDGPIAEDPLSFSGRKIRLISHRAFGLHSADPLIALVYLCWAGITIALPRWLHPHSNGAP